jgi:hypothetical protein
MIRTVSPHFARFIEHIEKDMITLAICDFHFCNVFEDLRTRTENPYTPRFADGTLAEFACIFTPCGFRWLTSRQERADSLDALVEVNSPIREAMVMKLEQRTSKALRSPTTAVGQT